MYYEWHEAMQTGQDQIDEQHKKLLAHIESILKTASQGKSSENLEVELHFFERYVIEHFTDEELLHKESLAPDYEAHVEAHRVLIDKTEALLHEIRMDGVGLATELKFYNSLVKSFIEQVHLHDVPLASFLKGKR